jgi:hypothetical protein
MECQNKREQLLEQIYMSSRTTNVVSEQIKTRVRHMFFLNENRGATPPGNRRNILKEETCSYYRQNKILL